MPAAAFQAAPSERARVFARGQRHLKAGGSQDWLPHKSTDLEFWSHLSFSVVKAQSASTRPAIQNLAMIFDSVQPSASKWWCSGAILKMRLP